MSLFPWLRNPMGNRARRAQPRPPAPRFRPRLEALEGRCVPATLKVTNLLDSGPGSLRYEIAQAKSGDTIAFDKKLDGGTITLTTGELDINKSLTIQGPGAGLLTVGSTGLANSGSLYNNGSSRIFEVERWATATLSGMTISNGVGFKSSYNPYGSSSSDSYDGTGGGVLNLGTLTISGCTLSNNFAAPFSLPGTGGGGVANFGTLTVSGCTLSNNKTFGNGGAICNGGGGYRGGTLTITGCTLSGNTGDNGGGIYNEVGGTLTVSGGCTLSGNSAWGNGSGASTGYSIEYGYGGGICNFGALTVSSCTLSGNSAYSGGGIYDGGTLTVSNSLFSSNTPDNVYGPYADGGGNTFQ